MKIITTKYADRKRERGKNNNNINSRTILIIIKSAQCNITKRQKKINKRMNINEMAYNYETKKNTNKKVMKRENNFLNTYKIISKMNVTRTYTICMPAKKQQQQMQTNPYFSYSDFNKFNLENIKNFCMEHEFVVFFCSWKFMQMKRQTGMVSLLRWISYAVLLAFRFLSSRNFRPNSFRMNEERMRWHNWLSVYASCTPCSDTDSNLKRIHNYSHLKFCSARLVYPIVPYHFASNVRIVHS